MTLSFATFKSIFSADVLKRGRDYHRNQHIRDLSYDDEDTWTAQVEGSETYDVEIVRQDDGSLLCDCTCPYAEMDLCKHMAAVLYAIEADFPEVTGKKKSTASSKPKPPKKDTLHRALEAASQAELVKLLLDWAKADRGMMDQLLLRLGAKGDAPADYTTMVKTALRAGKGQYGYIDRTGSNRIARELDLIIGQANTKHREGQIRVGLAIFRAILDTVLDAITNIEPSDTLIETLYAALEGLRRCGADLAPTERRETIEALMKYGGHYALEYIDWDVGPYEMAADLIETPEDRDFFLKALKKRKGDPYSNWNEYTAGLELRLIKRLDPPEMAREFLLKHSHLDSFRVDLIRESIAARDFATAKKYLQDARRKMPPMPPLPFMDMGFLNVYDMLALDIAKAENDTPQILALARQLWLGGQREEDYQLLKTNVKPDAWPTFVDGLLKDVKAIPEIRAWIYHREERWKDLFDLVKRTSYLLPTYQSVLEEHFPEDIVKFYEGNVFNMLREASNREVYKAACDLLLRMQELGEEDRVQEIVQLLKAEYPRRKALMEELGRF